MRHRWWFPVAALGAGFAVALVFSELALRIAGFSYPTFFEVDRMLGHRHRPGASGAYQVEGRAAVVISQEGLRDREHTLERHHGEYRIAVLGDSYAEALQVDVDSTFWAEFGRRVAHCGLAGGRPIEVLNFGVSGYSTLQELLQFRSEVRTYRPDLVLLAFLSGNDIRDHSPALAGRWPRPYPALTDSGLRVDTSFIGSRNFRIKASGAWRLASALSDHLRTVQLANRVMNRMRERGGARPVNGEPGLDAMVYAPPRDTLWRDAWSVTERLVLTLRREVEADGARFLVVSLSNGDQVALDTAKSRQLAERLGVADLFYPERRLRRWADSTGTEYLPLAPSLRDSALARAMHLHGFANTTMGAGHWNEQGHALAGQLIAAHLCAP